MADLREMPLMISCILSLRVYQLPLEVSNETNNNGPTACILSIDRNLQPHRAVSMRQHSFLVSYFRPADANAVRTCGASSESSKSEATCCLHCSARCSTKRY